ncbi:MAG: cation:dicarboxylate symporter family transporter [Bryobacteraceae bacterium]
MSSSQPLDAPRRTTWQVTLWSLAGLGLGFALGSALSALPGRFGGPLLTTLTAIGTLWMNALRAIAMPLAIGQMVCAMSRERSARSAGCIGGAVAIYVLLLLLGAALVLLAVPPILHWTPTDRAAAAALSQSAVAQSPTPAAPSAAPAGWGDMVANLMPRNLAQSAVNEEYLPLLVFAILFGIALRQVDPVKSAPVIRLFEGVTDALMVLVRWIIVCAPAAIFALAATFASTTGGRIIGIFGRVLVLECSLMLAYVALLYPLTRLAGGLSLRAFARAALGPQLVAVSTRSSLASLPALLAAGEQLLPSNPDPARIVLPLAVNMFKLNRTTTALCRLLVIWYFWSVPAQPGQLAVFLVTVILLSFSELGLPSFTRFRLVPAYLAAGCPLAAVMLFEMVEPISDVCMTLHNVTGDLAIAAIVTRWWGGAPRVQPMVEAEAPVS